MKDSNFSEPIAVVGRGCILPGARNPDELWDIVVNQRIAVREATKADWRIDPAEIVKAEPGKAQTDTAWSGVGGYIGNLPPFSHRQLGALEPALDPIFHMTAHAAAQAMEESGWIDLRRKPASGLIMGNLSYPVPGFTDFAAGEIMGKKTALKNSTLSVSKTDPRNRFMSGLPIVETARLFGLSGPSFSIDAACASALYAIKLACDRLHSGEADFMLAGGINAADFLCLHTGFSALNALSHSGRSRPLSQEADGLIPAQGAAVVALKRLADALEEGDRILGVIRGAGLSNDGRAGSFLTPSGKGQVRALERAYRSSGITPAEVGYVECHATGTQLGDETEIRSMASVFEESSYPVIGALKACIGHSVTASGSAGLLKILGMIEHGRLPGSPNVKPFHSVFEETPFEVLEENRDWTGRRLAGLSSFGFGGNNAHLVVEAWESPGASAISLPRERPANPLNQTFAVVGIEVCTHRSRSFEHFQKQLMEAPSKVRSQPLIETVDFEADDLVFPPADLKAAVGQQLLTARAAVQAIKGVNHDPETTGVYIGMQCDALAARYTARFLVPALVDSAGPESEERIREIRDAIAPPCQSAEVIGVMPNIVANRISHLLSLKGPGHTVSAEEISGDVALEIAMGALARGEISTALVGAADLCREDIHSAAAEAVLPQSSADPGDAAVVFVVKTRQQADTDKDTIFAEIESNGSAEACADASVRQLVEERFGHAHCASGLLQIAAGIGIARQHSAAGSSSDPEASQTETEVIEGSGRFLYSANRESLEPVLPDLDPRTMTLRNRSFTGDERIWQIRIPPSAQWSTADSDPQHRLMRAFAASSVEALIGILETPATGNALFQGSGCVRALVTGRNREELAAAQKDLAAAVRKRPAPGWLTPNGVFYPRPIGGDLAFAFSGSAAGYPGAGVDLIAGFPIVLDALIKHNGKPWLGGRGSREVPTAAKVNAFSLLKACSTTIQIHACLTRDLLGLKPSAALGVSSGESNSLHALGVWSDMGSMLDDIDESRIYHEYLSGQFTSIREHWGIGPDEPVDFSNWLIRSSPESIRQAIGSRDRVYLSIINSPKECLIAGDRTACREVIAELPGVSVIEMDFDFCCHCAAATPFHDSWWEIHNRKVTPREDVRIYSNHFGKAYHTLNSVIIADGITGQGMNPVDLPRTILQAWEDGARIFLEHGPRNQMTQSITETLGDRPHLALDLDSKSDPVGKIYRVAGELWAAGIDPDLAALQGHARRALRRSEPEPAVMSFPLRWPPANPDSVLNADPQRAAAIPALASAESPRKDAASLPFPPRISADTLTAVDWRSGRMASGHAAASLVPSPVARPAAAPMPHPAWGVLQRITSVHHTFLDQQQQAQAALQGLTRQVQARLLTQPPKLRNSVYSPENRIAVASVPGQSHEFIFPSLPETHPPRKQRPDSTESAPPEQAIAERMASELALPGPAAQALWEWPEMQKLASGKISEVFGPEFRDQDGYDIQVRLPNPPLLLCERILEIDAEPKSMGTGTIWTEHTVTPDQWYLHCGRMPAGIFIECGQADLTLISYLGIDSLNRGERAYRLLGCEITWLGEMPKIGDTLKYEIRIKSHANQGDVRLFFFEYECWIGGELRARVRNGQAGFFTRQELSESKGVVWEPTFDQFTAEATMVPGPNVTEKRSFSREEVLAYLDGESWACFGDSFAFAKTHHRSPRTEGGRLNFIEAITHFDPEGGPLGRGYLRAVQDVAADGCFLEGHFLNDPCMPGTLMANGCQQMMAFFLSALGFTLKKDGWRFEPRQDHPVTYYCRGQVTPESKQIVYEVFVDDIVMEAGAVTLFAHVLCTVDGVKALRVDRGAVSLVPDWPAAELPESTWQTEDDRPVARLDDFPLDYRSLMNCALGKPSEAFGPAFARYDGAVNAPRLPNPPYHFMTRISRVDGVMGTPAAGSEVEALYDIPDDAWYFGEEQKEVMPFCVLMEIGLQPCGWLATYNLDAGEEPVPYLLFRNLDGESRMSRAVTQEDRTIRTVAKLVSHSKLGEMIIVKFAVNCFAGDDEVLTMETAFGFFPPDAFENQAGLEITPEEKALGELADNLDLNLRTRPAPYFRNDEGPTLPSSRLLMIDRITGCWPAGGKNGKGHYRAEKTVDPGDWYFKAHFLSDPVQPGSLGVEALIQLVEFHMLHTGMDEGMEKARFEPCLYDRETEWHYRGQVVPGNAKAIFDIEILEEIRIESGVYVEAEGRLWVDGKKIYHVPRIGVQLVASN